jgi:poly(3-hydroxybutyrate) depolymerase
MKSLFAIILLLVLPIGAAAEIDSDSRLGTSETNESFDGRDFRMYVPKEMPPAGKRGMVIVLHGGLGYAGNIEKGLELDPVAEKYGFVVAYLNGTEIAATLPRSMKGWNAGGGCCGLPYKDNVDDVGYITRAAAYLAGKYRVDPHRIFGMGHSNGAMMTERLMCETNLLQAAIPISGPLNLDVESCPAAKGKRILAVHGEKDENVPIAGGYGSKELAHISYKSEHYSEATFRRSGADYRLYVVPGASHSLEAILGAFYSREHMSLGEKAARFFGLAK